MLRHLLGAAAAGLFLLLSAVSGRAAPIATTATATLRIRSVEFGQISVSGGGTVTVDVSANTLQIPAGLVVQTAPILVPVTSSSAAVQMTATGIGNLAGTLSLGGATGQVAGEICSGGGPAKGVACVGGGGLGGLMGLTGVLRFHVIPNVFFYPLTLTAARVGLGGSATPVIGPVDGAPWTLGAGRVAFTSHFTATNHTGTSTETTTGNGSLAGGHLTLVTPTYVNLLGRAVPVVASLEIALVPEPMGGLLIGMGLLGVASLATRRGG